MGAMKASHATLLFSFSLSNKPHNYRSGNTPKNVPADYWTGGSHKQQEVRDRLDQLEPNRRKFLNAVERDQRGR